MEIDIYGCEGESCATDTAGGDSGTGGLSVWTPGEPLCLSQREVLLPRVADG
jgi:hypothetical protein